MTDSCVYNVYQSCTDCDIVKSFKTRSAAFKYAASHGCEYVLRVGPYFRSYFIGVDF